MTRRGARTRIVDGITRVLSGLCLLGIGCGLLLRLEALDHLVTQVVIAAIAIVSMTLGVYVLVGGRRRRGAQNDTGDAG